jgi:hypothetical protein
MNEAGHSEPRRCAEGIEERLCRELPGNSLGVLEPGQPPFRLTRELASEGAEQLGGELAAGSDACHLREEDRSMRRGGEAGRNLRGEEAT